MVDIIIKKKIVQKLGFSPKNNSKGIYNKKYDNNYTLEVDFENKLINFGKKIKSDSKTTQNFSQEENWVVLECVNRLLEKGYNPEDLTLEKIYPTGHGTSGRLDLLVHKNKKAYLMIECKTFGNEFKKELNNLNKNGGQLFTYFQQDRDVEYLILYASKFENNEIQYANEIVKIEDAYRETSNVKDFYDRWSKLTTQNGLFEDWVNAYDFQSKALTLNQLKNITQKDSSFIFNRFLEILRHNVVSDKPNAFNKIFTLFLCKIVDENRNPDDELHFQWIEGVDDNISFQKRLTDLYKKGMQELLSKEVTDISDDEFNKKYGSLDNDVREKILKEITKIRLQKNNEFAIKEVFDEETFEENAKVLKEVVELLQTYKIRYAEKQQYLSDFFELLLTTGLKQESGQFFTPVPIARFICRSIPLNQIIQNKLSIGNSKDLLPTTIDYATGSGHFLTESMNEIQNIIQNTDETKLKPQVKSDITVWKVKPFEWAYDYVYGIEKDYRLVKTAKVGCYLHGDGIAQVIHTDGLGNFTNTKEYKNKLKNKDNTFPQDNKKFDIVISNPPYSVSAFKTNLKREFAEKDFELYKYLTDQSSEIECLFIERTKQLLKDDGIAGIILPSSILSNTGIYTKTREIILKYFDIISVVELGSNTFMATGTNTVILFLKRKNNYDWINIQDSINKFSSTLKDITVNEIENIFSKYVKHVWKEVSFNEYISIFKKKPTEKILNHEIYKEYNKIKVGKKEELINKIIELEKDKLLYFILGYSQKIVLVKSGEKNIEKTFLGYEFSNRRGSEGIHPIQRGKLIDKCTKLFDPGVLDNPTKASTYIYDAFENKFDRDINEELRNHISRISLIDMITFDRNTFEKNISLNVQEQVNTKWDLKDLADSLDEIKGNTTKIAKSKILEKGKFPVITQEKGEFIAGYSNENKSITDTPLILFGDHSSTFKYLDFDFIRGADGTVLLKPKKEFNSKYFYYFLKYSGSNLIINKDKYERHYKYLKNIKIPLPPKNIQEKIVKEIKILESEENAKNKIDELKEKINQKIPKDNDLIELGSISEIKGGKRVPKGHSFATNKTKYPYIRVSDFKNKTVNLSNLKYINENTFNVIKNYTISDKDLYISIAGTIGLIGTIPKELNGKSLTENAAKITNINLNKVNQKFLLYILNSENIKIQISKKTKALGVPKLALKRIETIKIPIPSVTEQNKIVKEIEKIETEISKLEVQIEEIPKSKEKVLKKYL